MPVAVAPAPRSHSFLANAIRGRSRAASEVGPPLPREPERAQLPKAASYTYFPQVKELEPEAPVAESKRSDDDDDDNDAELRRSEERTSGSRSGGSSPSSEEAPEAPGLQMQTLRPPTLTRRSSRFLSFTSKSRDSSVEPKPDPKQERKTERGRTETVKQRESPGGSPVRSLTKLRRKSWVVSAQQQRESSSPPKDKKNKHSEKTAESNKRKTLTTTATIPEESEARDTVDEAIQHPASLSKKNKRLSGLFSATASASNLPSVPKSFSTEQLPLYPQTHNPASPTHLVPPLPRNVSAEKLKGIKTEPRKKDELWTAFRTLDADLRKHDSPLLSPKPPANKRQISIQIQFAQSQRCPHRPPALPPPVCHACLESQAPARRPRPTRQHPQWMVDRPLGTRGRSE